MDPFSPKSKRLSLRLIINENSRLPARETGLQDLANRVIKGRQFIILSKPSTIRWIDNNETPVIKSWQFRMEGLHILIVDLHDVLQTRLPDMDQCFFKRTPMMIEAKNQRGVFEPLGSAPIGFFF